MHNREHLDLFCSANIIKSNNEMGGACNMRNIGKERRIHNFFWGVGGGT